MPDIYVYLTDLPPGVHEVIAKCCDGGFTVYLSTRDSYERQREAFEHAVLHVTRRDYEAFDVQDIENEAHREAG